MREGVLPGTAFPHASTAHPGGHNGRGYTSDPPACVTTAWCRAASCRRGRSASAGVWASGSCCGGASYWVGSNPPRVCWSGAVSPVWSSGVGVPVDGVGRGVVRRGLVLLVLGRADQLAARGGVAAVERRGLERVRGRRPVAAEAALDALHVVAPDVGGERAAVDVAAEVEAVHLDVVLRVADPDRRGQARREADEPGVRVEVGRAGLAARRAADRGVRARCRPGCSARGSRGPRRRRRRRRSRSA